MSSDIPFIQLQHWSIADQQPNHTSLYQTRAYLLLTSLDPSFPPPLLHLAHFPRTTISSMTCLPQYIACSCWVTTLELLWLAGQNVYFVILIVHILTEVCVVCSMISEDFCTLWSFWYVLRRTWPSMELILSFFLVRWDQVRLVRSCLSLRLYSQRRLILKDESGRSADVPIAQPCYSNGESWYKWQFS